MEGNKSLWNVVKNGKKQLNSVRSSKRWWKRVKVGKSSIKIGQKW